MPKLSVSEQFLLYMSKPAVESPPTVNTSVGVLSTGKINTDQSFKISGGGVLMNNNARIVGNSNSKVPQRLKDRNRESLVRTIF